MNSVDSFQVSVFKALSAFQSAVAALTAPAEQIGLEWRADSTHDDWEELVEQIFAAFVKKPVEQSDRYGALPLAPYDFDLADYSSYSWLELVSADIESAWVFVRFDTDSKPFDSLVFARVDLQSGRAAAPAEKLVAGPVRLRRRYRGRADDLVDSLDLDQ